MKKYSEYVFVAIVALIFFSGVQTYSHRNWTGPAEPSDPIPTREKLTDSTRKSQHLALSESTQNKKTSRENDTQEIPSNSLLKAKRDSARILNLQVKKLNSDSTENGYAQKSSLPNSSLSSDSVNSVERLTGSSIRAVPQDYSSIEGFYFGKVEQESSSLTEISLWIQEQVDHPDHFQFQIELRYSSGASSKYSGAGQGFLYKVPSLVPGESDMYWLTNLEKNLVVAIQPSTEANSLKANVFYLSPEKTLNLIGESHLFPK